ncbi:MAG: beta-lactamase family protein [Parvularculaceae bacterium]|nr:beta-lactamase family protein [Parvularculaceae bacterium]
MLRTVFAFVALVVGLSACGDQGSGPRREPVKNLLTAHFNLVEAWGASRIPGLVLARLEDCSVSETELFGVTDIDTREPMSDLTAMEAASLSKPVLAYMLMQLVDEGVVDLDEAIADTIDWPRIRDQEAYRALTPRMLLSHQSGLPNWAGDSGNPDREDPLKFSFNPGKKFAYSGEGYGLLQAFVEAKTGKGLETLFRERMGEVMPLSTYDTLLPKRVEPAFGHGNKGGKKKGRTIGQPTVPHAAYSLRTVLPDYARFAEHLCRGEGLSAESFAAFQEPQVRVARKSGGEISWALGIGRMDNDDGTVLFHWGDNGAFKAFIAVAPDTGRGVVFFANARSGLKLIEPAGEPSVGDLDPVIDWLGYGRP